MKKYLVFLPNNILYLNNFGLWIFRAVKHDEKICTVMVVKKYWLLPWLLPGRYWYRIDTHVPVPVALPLHVPCIFTGQV